MFDEPREQPATVRRPVTFEEVLTHTRNWLYAAKITDLWIHHGCYVCDLGAWGIVEIAIDDYHGSPAIGAYVDIFDDMVFID